jgi:hypothetical protein
MAADASSPAACEGVNDNNALLLLLPHHILAGASQAAAALAQLAHAAAPSLRLQPQQQLPSMPAELFQTPAAAAAAQLSL